MSQCENIGGIADKREKYCCAKSCEQCGGSGCDERPGGPTSCCGSKIPAAQICNVDGQKAPCHLKSNQ